MKSDFKHLTEIIDREIEFLVCKTFWQTHSPIRLRKKKGHFEDMFIWIEDLEKMR